MKGERLTISTPDGDFSAYVARPERTPAPAVVVIQEIFGVNQVMRDVADELARQGYLAVVPDLFWRIEPGIDITDQCESEWKRAMELFGAFDVKKGVEDIRATIDSVRGHTDCNGCVGPVGYCLGGLLAFLTATRTDSDATVSYYGVNIDKYVDEARGLTRSLLLHIAEEDGFVPKAAQAKIIEALRGTTAEIHTYPGRDHAFARKGGQDYHAGDAQTAEQRSLAFFREHLG